MIKKKLVFFSIIIFMGAFLLIMGYYLRFDRLGLAQISWVDCVQINDIKYYSNFDRTPIDTSLIGEKIGEVNFNVYENVHNPSYRFRNGDATFLEVGTEIYSVKSNSNAIAVKVAEQFFIYSSDLFK
jgi:hypothetical protein